MTFVQKLEKNQFGSLPKPGKVKVKTGGKEIICDFKGEVAVVGKLPTQRRFKVLNDTFEKGFIWVDRENIEQA
ncbi:MAG TPA: hypothetical protein VGB12_03930 [bacterium]|jgi:hypothetical protein